MEVSVWTVTGAGSEVAGRLTVSLRISRAERDDARADAC